MRKLDLLSAYRSQGGADGVIREPAAAVLNPLEGLFALAAAVLAMVTYAMMLPERYIACGAYAFTLIITLAVDSEQSAAILGVHAWEDAAGRCLGSCRRNSAAPVRRP